ncbi:hypothetical protein GQ600_22025 [Phytophthora cactorum]|nr:hypothetical protein GQ600_22025 [Phytophthora cactorum]
MPLTKWFRSHQAGGVEDEVVQSLAEALNTKANAKPTTQRSLRSRSLGSGLRVTRDVTADENLQCTRCQSRRRFTIDGLTYRHRHGEDGWSCNAVPSGHPLLIHSTTLTPQTHMDDFFNLNLGRSHLMTIPLPANAHPSIIFIDCPP